MNQNDIFPVNEDKEQRRSYSELNWISRYS